jgi:hypothetical protein
MCRYIALAVREKQFIQEFFVGYEVSENNNQILAKATPEGYTWLWISNLHTCACYLFEPKRDLEKELEEELAKAQKKYKKRGWTETKINRAVEELKNRISSRKSSIPVGLTVRLYEAIKNLVKEQRQCFFYVSWVYGDPDKEVFTIVDVKNFEILSETRMPFELYEENVLYRMT